MGPAIIVLLAFTLLSSTSGQANFAADNLIKLPVERRQSADKISCESFRFQVEANNIQAWETVPSHCRKYLRSYFKGKQYNLDIEAVANAATVFVNTVPLPRDLRPNAFVFDLDETLLSNLDYLSSDEVRYGTLPLNYTAFYEWVESDEATANEIPAIKDLYDAVLERNFKPIIISEAPSRLSSKRIKDLENAGYSNWEAIIFRGEEDNDLTSSQFKAKKVRELVVSQTRYRIVGTVGDQWSDLNIPHSGIRTFKVPNPVYYVR